MPQRIAQLPKTRAPTDSELTPAAEAAIQALHRTMREDEGAYDLAEAMRDAGGRLLESLAHLPAADVYRPGEDAEDFLVRFTDEVGGRGATLTDAVLRRAATSTGVRLLDKQRRETVADEGPSQMSGDLLCFVYRWFFADVVAEFLRAVVTMHIKLAFPVTEFFDPEDVLVGGIAERVVDLVANPCEEADKRIEALEDVAGVVANPDEVALADVARDLVPRSVRRVLGLASEEEES